MPVRMSKEVRAKYDKMTPNEKRKFTMDRKVQMRKNLGHKDPKEVKREAALAEKTSIQDMRGALAKMLKKHDVDPINELLLYAADNATKKTESIAIYKFLVPYLTPTLKAVDVQADMKMNVAVTLQSFAGANQLKLAEEAHLLEDDEYDEFENDELEDGASL